MDDAPNLTWKGRVIAMGVGVVFLIFAAEGVLRIAMPHWQEFYSGWFMRDVNVPGHGVVIMGRPGFDGYFAQNNGDFRVRIRINDFGLRNPEPVAAANGRVWFVGDSMAFGWGVEQNEMYSSIAGKILKFPSYNVASPGTNVCGYQALLARMPKGTQPRAVIIGLILENDIRAYDCRKAALDALPAEKISAVGLKVSLTRDTALYNFFAVSLKRVGFVRDILSAFGIIAKEHAYRRPLSEPEMEKAVERTAAEIDWLRSALPAGTPLAVLIAPARFEIRDGDLLFRRLRQTMSQALTGRQIPVIDPIEAFSRAGFEPTHFAHDGHWSRLGHELAGRAAARWLRLQGIGG